MNDIKTFYCFTRFSFCSTIFNTPRYRVIITLFYSVGNEVKY